jgi:hypothetical protein
MLRKGSLNSRLCQPSKYRLAIIRFLGASWVLLGSHPGSTQEAPKNHPGSKRGIKENHIGYTEARRNAELIHYSNPASITMERKVHGPVIAYSNAYKHNYIRLPEYNTPR